MTNDAEEDATFKQLGGSGGMPTEVSYRLAVVEGPDRGRYIDVTALVPMPILVGQGASAARPLRSLLAESSQGRARPAMRRQLGSWPDSVFHSLQPSQLR